MKKSLFVLITSILFFSCGIKTSNNEDAELKLKIAKRDSFFSIKGVDVTGDVNEFKNKMIQAGYKKSNSGVSAKHALDGTYANSECKIAIFEENNIVNKVSITINGKPNTDIFSAFLDKYSSPDRTIEILDTKVYKWELYSGEISYCFELHGTQFVTKVDFETKQNNSLEERIEKAKKDM